MKKAFIFSLLFSISLSFSQAVKRPNIILFLVDDLGWQDCSLPFWKEKTPLNKKFYTPNMELLAKEGIKFTNAYATPVCTPSRVSLLTGVNPAHSKITNWTSTKANTPTDLQDEQFGMANWNYNGLSNVSDIPKTFYATPFPQILANNGYETILIGKAHWGPKGMPGSNPKNLGFTINIGGSEIGRPASYLGDENFGNAEPKCCELAVPNLENYYGKDMFLTEVLTLEALKNINKPLIEKKPFFLMLSHYAVHDPYDKDKRFYQKYIDKGLSDREARYAAMVEGVDKSLGDVMAFLKEKNIENETIIIFMSDNGGLSLGYARDGVPYTQNAPLKSGKGSVYEGGIREPMIVKWKNVVKPNSISDKIVRIDDFFPTILEMASIKKYQKVQQLDGISFVPALKGVSHQNSKTFIWHMPHKWTNEDGPGINYCSAIRKGDWKLVYHQRDGKKELFNIKEDIGETKDLHKIYPNKTRRLYKKLSNQLEKWDAPMPLVKEKNEFLKL